MTTEPYPSHRQREAMQSLMQGEWLPLLKRFTGAHPRVALDWVRQRLVDDERRVGPRRLRPEHLRLYLSDWIERLTGERVFEFRNYRLV